MSSLPVKIGRTTADWWEYYGFDEPLRVNVSVKDDKGVFTGILDADGDEIFRTKNPIGFGRERESEYTVYK